MDQYKGRISTLASKHDKLPLIAPPMLRQLDLEVVGVDVDTDLLGTFSGEVTRDGDMLTTAVRKARMGMQASGLDLGFASEGSIGRRGFFPTEDFEIVVFVDDSQGITVTESATSFEIAAHSWRLDTKTRLEEELSRAGFPEHGLIVRDGEDTSAPIHKGIHELDHLLLAIKDLHRHGSSMIQIESDLRANHSPSRRLVIAKAAEKLARRIATACPACSCPGWGEVRRLPGRRCAGCLVPTRLALAVLEGCARCDATRTVDLGLPDADPDRCEWCNP